MVPRKSAKAAPAPLHSHRQLPLKAGNGTQAPRAPSSTSTCSLGFALRRQSELEPPPAHTQEFLLIQIKPLRLVCLRQARFRAPQRGSLIISLIRTMQGTEAVLPLPGLSPLQVCFPVPLPPTARHTPVLLALLISSFVFLFASLSPPTPQFPSL